MCVIAYAPPGVSIMDACIEKMFNHNPDGAGIMYKPVDGNDVVIRKGFMKVEELKKAWSEIPVDCERALHCRIATSGKISVGCCHPFPVREYAEQMKHAEDHAPVALMHNGIFDFCTPKDGVNSTFSDSMLFASRYLYRLKDKLDDPTIQSLLNVIVDNSYSKLLIFNKDAKALLLGDWEKKDGVYYSNLNHEYSSFGRGYSCTAYDDLDFGYGYESKKRKKRKKSNVGMLSDSVLSVIDDEERYYTITLDVTDEINSAIEHLLQTQNGNFTNDDVKELVENEVFDALDITIYDDGYSKEISYWDSMGVDTTNGTFEFTVLCYGKLEKKDLKNVGLKVINLFEVDDHGKIINKDIETAETSKAVAV